MIKFCFFPLLIVLLNENKSKGQAQEVWSYDGITDGPQTWLEKFPRCNGNRQSPIDIQTASTGKQKFSHFILEGYSTTPESIFINNTGNYVRLGFQYNGKRPSISGGGLEGTYTFAQLHFHWGQNSTHGSDHGINGRRFPMEMHVVHTNNKYKGPEVFNHSDGVATFSFLYQIGCSWCTTRGLKRIVHNLPKIQKSQQFVKLEGADVFSLTNLLGHPQNKFYRYPGSMTTPLCIEVVTWTVFQNTLKITEQQMKEFRKILTSSNHSKVDRFRDIQPLNGRQVYMIEGRRISRSN